MSHGSHQPNPITKFATSVPAQNLTDEGLLLKARRDAENRPMMGGIPLIAKLGQGGMGAVYYGIHPRLNLEVAVKVLPFHLADANPDMIKRFFGEAQIAARVQSEHIVRVLDVNEESGVYYLVMEFVRGMSAAGVLKALQKGEYVSDIAPVTTTPAGGGVKALPTAAALAIVVAAARGLSAAHGSGVIHRDIKPDNIMIPRMARTDPLVEPPLDLARAKLADLGLAKIDDGNSMGTMSQMAMGTPGFMAPEQIRDAKRATKRSDVFSLGATLYALLAGRMPFAGSGVGDILIKTVSAPHEPLAAIRPDVPPAVSELIDCCLQKEPEGRFADGAAFLEAVLAVLGGGSLPAGAGGSVRAGAAGVGGGGSGRGSMGSATPPSAMPTAGAVAAGTVAIEKAEVPAGTGSTVGVRPARGRAGLVITLVVLLVVLIGGGSAGWWYLIAAPAQEDFLRQVSRVELDFEGDLQSYNAGKLNDAEYLQRLERAQGYLADLLAKRPDNPEAQHLQVVVTGEHTRMQEKLAGAKDQTESRFHALYNAGMLKEAAAQAEPDEATRMGLWRQAADLYSQAHALKGAEPGPAEGLTRAQKLLSAYALQSNAAVTAQLAAAQALEASAAAEPDLAKQLQLWNDAGAAYEKLHALAPEHPAAAPGQARVKAALEDIRNREGDESKMLALAAQVAADRGSVAQDPVRGLEDWTAAANGFEKALALQPNNAGWKSKRDNAVKQKNLLTQYLAAVKAGEVARDQFNHAHDLEGLKAAADAFQKACTEAAARMPELAGAVQAAATKALQDQLQQLTDAEARWHADGPSLELARQFDEVTQANPAVAYAWCSSGEVLRQVHIQDDPTAAADRDAIGAKFLKATQLDPKYGEAWYDWALLTAQSEVQSLPEDAEHDGVASLAQLHALPFYLKAVQADPTLQDAWYDYALALQAVGQNSAAYRAIQKVIVLNPKHETAYGVAAEIAEKAGLYGLSADMGEKAVAQHPDDGNAWNALAIALQEAGQPEAALAPLQKACVLLPEVKGIAERRDALVKDLAQRKQLADDCTRFKTSGEVTALTVEQYCEWARDLATLGRLREAGQRAKAATEVEPDNAAGWDCWALVCSQQNDYTGAVEKETKAVALKADDKVYPETLAGYQEELNSEKETRALFAGYAKALENNPHDAVSLYEWAVGLYNVHQLDDALMKVKRGLEIAPDDADLLGQLYLIQNDLALQAHAPK